MTDERDTKFRLTIDLMPGGVHDREPIIQESDTLAEALTDFERAQVDSVAPYELTLYEREAGTIKTKMLRRLTVYTEHS